MTNELKPCPSCTGDDVELSYFDTPGTRIKDHYVYCGPCGVRGPFGSERGAVAGWNGLPREVKPAPSPAALAVAEKLAKSVVQVPGVGECLRDGGLTAREIRAFCAELGVHVP